MKYISVQRFLVRVSLFGAMGYSAACTSDASPVGGSDDDASMGGASSTSGGAGAGGSAAGSGGVAGGAGSLATAGVAGSSGHDGGVTPDSGSGTECGTRVVAEAVVLNAGFEDPALSDDGFTNNSIPGWVGSDVDAVNNFGVYNPPTTTFRCRPQRMSTLRTLSAEPSIKLWASSSRIASPIASAQCWATRWRTLLLATV